MFRIRIWWGQAEINLYPEKMHKIKLVKMAFHWKAILLTMLIWKLDFGLWFWGSNLSNPGSFLVPNVSFQIYCLAIQNISFKKWFNTALIKILIKLEMFFHYFFFQYLLSFIIYVGCRSGFWSKNLDGRPGSFNSVQFKKLHSTAHKNLY